MPKSVSKKNNSLSNNYPYMIAEWKKEKNGDLSPSDLTCGSNRKVWWRCSNCGHEWPATINHRANGHGCPKCAKGRAAEKLTKKNLIPGQTDLGTLFPGIAKEWHPSLNGDKTPVDYSPNSMRSAWWICPKGHAYELDIAHRTSLSQGCPYCAGKRVLPGFNDLSSKFPTIASEWDFEHNTILPDGRTAIYGLYQSADKAKENDRKYELLRDSILEKVIMLTVSYYCLSSELRYLSKDKNNNNINGEYLYIFA